MHVQEMISTHPHVQGDTNQSLIQCVELCYDCAQSCTACAEACRDCEAACVEAAQTIEPTRQ